MYEWIDIREPADFAELTKRLEADFEAPRVVKILQEGINSSVAGVLIERDYIDKDYRSVFYHFYAKMGRPYRSDCVRLHFFDSTVSFNAEELDFTCSDDIRRLSDHYFGYTVLRPTSAVTIGRTALSPRVRKDALGDSIVSVHKAHVLGYTLKWNAFPSMDQHADIVVCAHVACWSILRHYSERYSQHRELLVHDIKVMAHAFDPGGLAPARGLDIYQAERVFQAAGTYPLVITRKSKEAPGDFYDQLLAYLESGFPLFVEMLEEQHAIVAVGRTWQLAETPAAAPSSASSAWGKVGSVTVIDDNKLPYLSVPVRDDGQASYSADDFTRFIVPLPEKIFYPASAVASYARSALSVVLRSFLDMPAEEDMVIRFFVMTIAKLREYARKSKSSLPKELVIGIMQLEAAQFVWVVEFASNEQWANGQVSARAVLDASASPKDTSPTWLAYSAKRVIFFDRSKVPADARFAPLTSAANALPRMEQNLRPVAS